MTTFKYQMGVKLLRFKITRWAINLILKRDFIYIRFKGIEECNFLLKLKEKEISLQKTPNYGEGSLELATKTPEVRLYKFTNCYMNIESSSIYSEDGAFIELFQGIDQQQARYNAGHLIWHDTERALFEVKVDTLVGKKVLFLGGNGSFNYFHWLIEILPKLLLLDKYLIEKYSIEAIVVNQVVKEIPNYKKVLEIVNAELKLPLIYLEQKTSYKFSEVYYITTFNNVLFNSVNNIPRIEYGYFSISILKKLRNLVLSKNVTPRIECENKYPKKIFLLRGEVSNFNKRFYNESEVAAFFIKKGFVCVKPEKYDFLEQVCLFSRASYIVGPSGAFWSNLIFCKENTKCISWLTGLHKDFSVYSTIADLFKIDMKFLTANMLTSEMHGSYHVDIKEIEELYAQYE
ncbi:glycosyltransferase family 61 protein [Acinetobacter sp. GXMZU3951]